MSTIRTLKVVEERFVRLGKIMHLHVGGQVIRTTAEHPFYVWEKGWTAAGQLQVGDLLASHDEKWVAVEDLLETGECETVYWPSGSPRVESRVRVERPGFRIKTLIVATTLLDADEFTQDDLAQLYRARWNAELDLRSLKKRCKWTSCAARRPS